MTDWHARLRAADRAHRMACVAYFVAAGALLVTYAVKAVLHFA
jgi:hypothetical protein